MSLVSDAITAALQSLSTIAGGEITYSRDGEDDLTFNATFGRTEYDVIGSDGIATRFIAKDFIFTRSLLDFGAGATVPKRNDIIEASIDGVAKLFQVLELNGVCFSSDPHGVMFRVHTKEVGNG